MAQEMNDSIAVINSRYALFAPPQLEVPDLGSTSGQFTLLVELIRPVVWDTYGGSWLEWSENVAAEREGSDGEGRGARGPSWWMNSGEIICKLDLHEDMSYKSDLYVNSDQYLGTIKLKFLFVTIISSQ